jgi:hypothetical protein
MLKRAFLLLALMAVLSPAVFAQERTIVRNKKAKQMLMGRHKLSLQWISWDYFGTAAATERRGVVYLKGRQDGRGQSKGDYVTVDGIVTEIDARQFTFDGTIITKISHINGGEPCERKGLLNFRITGARKYWRLQQMDNPCDEATDYVDIFFR